MNPTLNPLNHFVFNLSLPLGILALLLFPFLLLWGRRQTPRQRAVWGPYAVSGLVFWLLGIVVTLAGAQQGRTSGGRSALLLGNALVCLGGLAALYAALRLWVAQRNTGRA